MAIIQVRLVSASKLLHPAHPLVSQDASLEDPTTAWTTLNITRAETPSYFGGLRGVGGVAKVMHSDVAMTSFAEFASHGLTSTPCRKRNNPRPQLAMGGTTSKLFQVMISSSGNTADTNERKNSRSDGAPDGEK